MITELMLLLMFESLVNSKRFKTFIVRSILDPINGEEWEGDILNSFGNLALVTVSANSKFSNMLPSSKEENYKEIIGQSPKLMRMSKLMKENDRKWNSEIVERHRKEMCEIINQEINRYSV